MTRPFDGDGPGATTVIKAGRHLVNKLTVGYTSIPLAKQASRWLNNFPSRWTSPRVRKLVKKNRRLNKHPVGQTSIPQASQRDACLASGMLV